MSNISTTSPALQLEAETTVHLLDDWFEAIEVGLRERVREFLQAMIESELETALARPRYGRRPMADVQNGERYLWPPPRPPLAITDGDLWPGRDRSAARQARQCGGQERWSHFALASFRSREELRAGGQLRRTGHGDVVDGADFGDR